MHSRLKMIQEQMEEYRGMKTNTKVLIGTLAILIIVLPLMTNVLADEGDNGIADEEQGQNLRD